MLSTGWATVLALALLLLFTHSHEATPEDAYDEAMREYYQGEEPEGVGDVVGILMKHEAVRGLTFGTVGAAIAILMLLIDAGLRRVPKWVMPREFIPILINGCAVFSGILMSISQFIDVSHGVHMATEAIALYSLGHGLRRRAGIDDDSSIFFPGRVRT